MKLCSSTESLPAAGVFTSLVILLAKLVSAVIEDGTSSSTCPENVASLSGIQSEGRTTNFFQRDRFIEIEFKLKFGSSPPSRIDQGIRLEARLKSTGDSKNTDWFPIRFYTPTIEESSYMSLVKLDSSNISVTAKAGSYDSSLPLLIVNGTGLVIIREHICGVLLQNISETLQLELRWMQRFGRNIMDNNDSTWIFDDVKVSIWNGTCFFQVLSEDFSGNERVIFDSYLIIRGILQQNVSGLSETSNFLDFTGAGGSNPARRSINIPIYIFKTDEEEDKCSNFCSAEITANLNVRYSWKETVVGNISSLPCNFSSYMATRLCGLGGVWLQPDSSLCEEAGDLLSNVLNETVTLETLEGQLGLVSYALSIIENDESHQTQNNLVMVETFLASVSDLFVEFQTTVTQLPVVVKVVGIINSLMQWSANLFEETGTSSSIIGSYEDLAAFFAQSLPVNESITISGVDFTLVAENLPLEILQQSGRSISLKEGILDNGDELAVGSPVSSITLPPSLFANIGDTFEVGLFFVLHQKSTLFPLQHNENSTFPETDRTTIVGSSIIAATVGSALTFDNLQPPVVINLTIPTEINGSVIREGSEVCAYWDFGAAGNRGNWTTEGCVAVTIRDGVVTCHCNHLTNFAVLIDICSRIQPEGCINSGVFDQTLSIITYIGIASSVIGLIITIITMLAFKKLRDRDVTKFHIQLFLAILFMLVAFVAGVDKTEVVGGCIAASVLIHYFTLTSILWMLAESLLMLQKIVFVFEQLTKKGIIISSLMVWFTPIIPVAILLIIDFANGDEESTDLIIDRKKSCFLNNPIAFWLAFLGPILGVILVNSVIFIIVIIVLVRQKQRMLSRNRKHVGLKTVILLIISLAGIMFLFGITWIFAAFTFSVNEIRKPSQVLFTVLNSFQGFFIFVFFCISSKEMYDLWREVLCCGKYKSTFSNQTTRRSKNPTGTYKDHLERTLSSVYTSRHTSRTSIRLSSEKKTPDLPIHLKCTSTGKKYNSYNDPPEPAHPARAEQKGADRKCMLNKVMIDMK